MKAVFLVHIVAKAEITPVAQTLLGVNIHATPYLLGQLQRIILGQALQHTLHKNAAGIVTNVLFYGDHPTAILFQLALVKSVVVAISGEAIKPIEKHAIKNVLIAVGNHALELDSTISWTLCARSMYSPITICPLFLSNS